MNHDKLTCSVKGCGICDTTAQSILSHSPKPESDCSGCTDRNSEGTHQAHTVQHPCKEGGDPNCGYCVPKPESEWADFDERFVKEPVCKHGQTTGHYTCEPHDYPHVLGNRFGPDCETCSPPPKPTLKDIKAYITANYFPKKELASLLTEAEERERKTTYLEVRGAAQQCYTPEQVVEYIDHMLTPKEDTTN